MDAVQKKLGRRVRDLREAAGLSQAALAEKVGVVDETISRLERGAAMPSLVRMERISEALGADLGELFRFGPIDTRKARAVERLLSLVRRRSAEDIDAITDLVAGVFKRWR